MSDVLKDAFAILNPEKKDVTKEEAKKYLGCKDESELRKKIDEVLIKPRKLALGAMKQGITLRGKYLV